MPAMIYTNSLAAEALRIAPHVIFRSNLSLFSGAISESDFESD